MSVNAFENTAGIGLTEDAWVSALVDAYEDRLAAR